MAAEIEGVDEFLNNIGVDPKESETRLEEIYSVLESRLKLFDNHKEVMDKVLPSRKGQQKYIDFLVSKLDNRTISDVDAPKETLLEVAFLEYNTDYVFETFLGLLGCIKCIDDLSIRQIAASRALQLVSHAISDVHKIPENNANGHHFILTKRAKIAREKRAASPREIALIAAIEAELGASSILRPNKEAEAMLDAVNRRLGADGFPPVKLDVVRRRLEKRAALLKSAEKASE